MKTVFPGVGIPIIKIIKDGVVSYDGIPILVRRRFYIGTHRWNHGTGTLSFPSTQGSLPDYCMKTSSNGNISALLAPCAGNSLITGEFPSQKPVTRSLYVFFDLRLNKGLSKQSSGWWFETPSCSLWRRCNGMSVNHILCHLIFEWVV